METELRSAAGDPAQGVPQTGQAPEAMSTVPGQTSPRNDLAKKEKVRHETAGDDLSRLYSRAPRAELAHFLAERQRELLCPCLSGQRGELEFHQLYALLESADLALRRYGRHGDPQHAQYFAVNLLLIFPLTLIMSYFIYKRVAGVPRVPRHLFPARHHFGHRAGERIFQHDLPDGPIGALLKAMGVQMPGEGISAQSRHGDARHSYLLYLDGLYDKSHHHQQCDVAHPRGSAGIGAPRRLFVVQGTHLSHSADDLVLRFDAGHLHPDGHLQRRAVPSCSSTRTAATTR